MQHINVKWLATAMMVLGALLFLAATGSRLSPDAIAMAIGLTLGVLAGVPSAALVLAALRGDRASDDNDPPTIDAYPEPAAEDVTPYTHTFRRLTGMPPLPTRQQQIDQLRAALDYIEAQEVR